MGVINIKNLDEGFLSYNRLFQKLNSRNQENDLLKFVGYNRQLLNWLGIDVFVVNEENRLGIRYCSSNYVGAIPLRHPQTGLYYADLVVTNRFQEDVVSLTELLEEYIAPDFIDLDLYNSESVRAPLYFDCINYILAFPSAIKSHWNKFDVTERDETKPKSGTNWTKYALNSYNPVKLLRYPNRNNTLNLNHTEWQQLCYVLTLAINELNSYRVPTKLKARYCDHISLMKQYLTNMNVMVKSDEFSIRAADPNSIKQLKQFANIILANKRRNAKAWRIDSAELFERYIQYICNHVSKRIGGRASANPKFSITGSPYRPAWCLRYLEPDVVLMIKNTKISIDAKYKAHMLNHSGEELKESFRSDLHQVLAYSSFSESSNKIACIFYPYTSKESDENNSYLKTIKLDISSCLSSANITTFLLGVSLNVTDIPHIIDQFSTEISKILELTE